MALTNIVYPAVPKTASLIQIATIQIYDFESYDFCFGMEMNFCDKKLMLSKFEYY